MSEESPQPSTNAGAETTSLARSITVSSLRRAFSRRSLMRWITAVILLRALPRAANAQSQDGAEATPPHGFEEVPRDLPAPTQRMPQPPLAPPAGCTEPVFDIFGNHWVLGPADGNGHRTLLVLAAQAPDKWTPDTHSHLSQDAWQHLGADEFGYLWIASSSRCLRLDPHTPEAGWTDFSADIDAARLQHSKAADAAITAMGLGPSGAIVIALRCGTSIGLLAELDRQQQTSVTISSAPWGVERIASDDRGEIWLRCSSKTWRKPAAGDAWQHRWEMVDRLPAGDHDLSGDILDGHFYMAGGQNAGWGYPAVPHVFNQLFEFNPATHRWRTAARISPPRFYNGTSCLDGRVWIIAGYTRDADYKAVRLDSVQIWDPATSTISNGPPLPIPLDNPLALCIQGRIYIAGSELTPNTSLAGPQHPCILLSIGAGETTWRREPDGPTYLLALAGTVHDGDLYLALPGKGLARFSTRDRTWQLIPLAHAARSPQMATYRDEIWIMGGRDIDRQDAVTIYRPSDRSWRSGPSLPRPLAWGAATQVGGRLMVVGGAAGRGYNNRTFLLRDEEL